MSKKDLPVLFAVLSSCQLLNFSLKQWNAYIHSSVETGWKIMEIFNNKRYNIEKPRQFPEWSYLLEQTPSSFVLKNKNQNM